MQEVRALQQRLATANAEIEDQREHIQLLTRRPAAQQKVPQDTARCGRIILTVGVYLLIILLLSILGLWLPNIVQYEPSGFKPI